MRYIALLLCLVAAAPAKDKPTLASVEARIAVIERELAALKAIVAELKGEKPVDLDAEAKAGNILIGMDAGQVTVALAGKQPTEKRKTRTAGGLLEIWDFDEEDGSGAITSIRFENGKVTRVDGG
jgi:hypothetical protein